MTLTPLHRAWRALPQGPRRRLLDAGTRLLAPRPDRPPLPPAPGLAVAGELRRASGLGEGARMMLAGVEALGLPGWEAAPGLEPPPPGVPLAVHANAAALPLFMLRLGRARLRGRPVVGVWPWELPEVPPAWRVGFRYVHAVWAPSRFSAEAVRRALPPGFDPGRVRVVPHPVAVLPPRPAPMDREALGLPPGAVITLLGFSMASSFTRKNPLGAIEAHRLAFGNCPDRVLLIRAGEAEHFPNDWGMLRNAVGNAPNIILDTRTRPRDEAHALMAAADIVLSLHRSEGFGLVPAEAMVLGKPVVATAWSGTEDFLRDDWACRIPYHLVPANDPRGVFHAPNSRWAEPDVGAAAECLRTLADDPALRARMGAAARRAAPDLFGPAPLGAALAALGAAA